MILDGHTHLFSHFENREGMPLDGFVATLKDQGIDGALLFTFDGFFHEDTRPYNDELKAAVDRYPSFLHAFGTVHPRGGERALEEMRRCVRDLGMRGFKFHSWLQAFCASSKSMFPLVEQAAELKVPMLFHDGTPPYSSTLQVAYLARCFPRATIILGHSGLRDSWKEALYAARKYPNLMLQFCGTPQIGMRTIIQEIGWERCIFGSDFPLTGMRSPAQMARQIEEIDVSGQAKEAILGGNLKRLLESAAAATADRGG